MYGGIDAGGTKVLCGVGTGPGDLRTEVIPTSTPTDTLDRVADALLKLGNGELSALGVGTFGPIDLDPRSPSYGRILSTPKRGWADVDLLGALRRRFPIPIRLDTDINCAALGERRWGISSDRRDSVFVSVGTGIGGAAICEGRLLRGSSHLEIGHLRIGRDPALDPYPGNCPFHRDCWEGLASGPAIEGRWGIPIEQIPPEHEAWKMEARYLGRGLANCVHAFSPQLLILGGGVLERRPLLPAVRQQLSEALNGYVPAPPLAPPGLGRLAGVLGAISLAEDSSSGAGRS